MPEEKELFAGLDSLIFDQTTLLDVDDFNKKVIEPENKVDSTKETKGEEKVGNKSTKEEDLIDPNEFFNRTKEAKEETTNEVEVDEEEDNKETKPEEVLNQWSDYFKENTILSENDLEDFDGTIEALTKAFEKREIRTGLEMVDDYKAQLPAELKFLADNWEEGVPLNELIDIRSNKIKYSLITEDKLEESVDTQKATHKDYLKRTTRFSEAKIDKEIQRLIDLDELKDESKESLKELKVMDDQAEELLKKETKKQREARVEENAKQIKAYEKYVNSTKEVIPGLKLEKKDQESILKKIIDPVGIDVYGNPVSYLVNVRNADPQKFDTAVTYLASITTDKEGVPFNDWSKIIKTGETKATKNLENILNTKPPKTTKDNIKTDKKDSLLDTLARNANMFKR